VWTGSDPPTITVRADVTEELGSEVNVLFMIDAPPVETDETIERAGRGRGVRTPRQRTTGGLPCQSRPSHVERTGIAGAPVGRSSTFHFFDPHTGLAITPEPARAATA
jgi:multiple sugar transport system ATP-binding protein